MGQKPTNKELAKELKDFAYSLDTVGWKQHRAKCMLYELVRRLEDTEDN